MDMRQIKGLEIAKNGKILKTPKGFIVPSQLGNSAYLVHNVNMKTACDCPDCVMRGNKCKHPYAVEYFLQQITDTEGNTTVIKVVGTTERASMQADSAQHSGSNT